jgi:uncharacterized membrane protein YtjA (UPF0391 family)
MSYSAMIFLILAIFSALMGFGPDVGSLSSAARVLSLAFTVLCVLALLAPRVLRRGEDRDEI